MKIIPSSQVKQIDHKVQAVENRNPINKLECYNLLDREFAQYLIQTKHPIKRQTLTRNRLSDHKHTIETGLHKREWLERTKNNLYPLRNRRS